MTKKEPPQLKMPKVILLICIVFLTLNLTAQDADVVIVDENFSNKAGLLASLPVGTPVITTNSQVTLQQALESAITNPATKANIHLFCTSDDSSIVLGNQSYSAENISSSLNQNIFAAVSEKCLLIYSCSLAKNQEGISLMETIADQTNMVVASCFSCESIDEELEFDFTTSPILISSSLFK